MQLIRWPADDAQRERCRQKGILRVLVIEGGAQAPICADLREDWVRTPITRDDLAARLAALRARTSQYGFPEVDPGGSLRFGARSVAVSPTEARLLTLLARNFGNVVARASLADRLSPDLTVAGRNALDLHIMRIRRRLADVGLVIETVRGRGYALTQRFEDRAESDLATSS